MDTNLEDPVAQCPDLDLTAISGQDVVLDLKPISVDLIFNQAIDDENIKPADQSVSTSVREQAAFELLEEKAEKNESFVSSLSYANRFWGFQSKPTLMPPSLFERKEDSDDTLNISEIVDQSDHPNLQHEDNIESDTDTHSVASASQFHGSLPIIASTPPAHLAKKKFRRQITPNNSDQDSLPVYSPYVVRKLFPNMAAPSSDKNSPMISEEKENRSPESHSAKSETNSNFLTKIDISSSKSESGNSSARVISARSVTLSAADGSLVEELQEKLKDIKAEISKLKTENSRATKIRLEYDAGMKQMARDRKLFDEERFESLKQLDERVREEMKKTEMERRILYKHFSEKKMDDNKKITESNRELIHELNSVRDELKKVETREQMTSRRLKERMQVLEEQNERLKDKADALEEDKQELVREVVRLTKRGPMKPLSPLSNSPKSMSSPVAATPRNVAPSPTENPADKLPVEAIVGKSPQNSARSVLKSAEGISPPRSVRFEVDASFCSSNGEIALDETVEANGTTETIYKDGRRVRKYKNGTKKEVAPDGKCSITTFYNGDVWQILPDKETYFYNQNQTVQTKYPDGSEVYQFANNQTEKLFPDGRKEIKYPRGMQRTIYPNNNEEVHYTDGNVVYWNDATRTRSIYFANGEIETHAQEFKRRDFPDGSQKTVWNDGRQETKHANGRVRIKDGCGQLIFDSAGTPTKAVQAKLSAAR